MDKRYSILVIEDEEDIQQLVTYNLVKADFQVWCAPDGEKGLQSFLDHQPDLIVLDLMLPGMDGLTLCQRLRTVHNSDIPVLMLTAKGEEEDIVAGLAAGADDYLPKPFSPRVLLARINALLRRSRLWSEDETVVDPDISFPRHQLAICPHSYTVSVADQNIHLTHSEFQILLLLTKKPGWVYSRQQIINDIRGFDYSLTERAIDVLISGLRKKLGAAGAAIETVRGVGYRFSVQP
ncbi:MAG: response regulator transcription factor [Deltaproteobacteria bacterium]|jgi:two-component system alkaline phosphatase synthesis response regulator PhoP|nr:response regulator transcription factor [Deltaproteobacteria bacterium]